MVTPRRARLGRRSGERGATVFIVVLVLVMLTAIGVFAAGASSLATTASGHERQMTQTRYLTEYAISLVLADIEKAHGMAKIDAARLSAIQGGTPPRCSNQPAPPAPPDDKLWCFPYIPRTLQAQTDYDLVTPSTPGPSGMPGTPGSLGVANVGWNFKVELTDKVPAIIPPPGANLTTIGAVSVHYWMVAVNARGVIWPNGGAPDAIIASAGSQDALTAYITTP